MVEIGGYKMIGRLSIRELFTCLAIGIVMTALICVFLNKDELATAQPTPTVQTTSEPIQTPQPTETPQVIPKYDIPLSEDLQTYLFNKCKENEISYEFVLKLISVESNFNVSNVSVNKSSIDIGLMQINSKNAKWMKEALGVTNLYNPYQNIDCGIYILKCGYSEDLHKTLMSYNMGIGTTNKLFKQGVYSSEYSRLVLSKNLYLIGGS